MRNLGGNAGKEELALYWQLRRLYRITREEFEELTMQDLAALKVANNNVERRQDLRFAWLECAVLNLFKSENQMPLTPAKLLRDRPYGN